MQQLIKFENYSLLIKEEYVCMYKFVLFITIVQKIL